MYALPELLTHTHTQAQADFRSPQGHKSSNKIAHEMKYIETVDESSLRGCTSLYGAL